MRSTFAIFFLALTSTIVWANSTPPSTPPANGRRDSGSSSSTSASTATAAAQATQQQAQQQSQTQSTSLSSTNQTAVSATASPVLTASPTASATGGAGGSATSSANGGAGGAGGTANASAGSATSSSGGNSQSTSFISPRQAPALAQGSLAIVGCAAGLNGGTSGAGGASFLGFAWVTSECHGWTLAQSLLAIGDARGACEVLHAQQSFKRARDRGAKVASCDELAR